MSSSKVALAEHILYEHFGAAVGVLGGILLARGRLSYETILRLLPRSTFKQATAQAALLVLVQHNCLYYVQDEEEGTEYFEMNLEAILQRRRYGQFMALTREHWGKRAFEVLQQVLVDGKSKLSNLLEDCSHLVDRTQTIKAIYDLLDAGVLQPVKVSDQTSVEDQDLQLEKQLMREFKGPPTPKDLKQIKIDVEERREKLRAEPRTWGKDHMSYVATCLGDEGEEHGNSYGDNDSTTGQKRRAAGTNGQSSLKSQRMMMPFDVNTWVRVNHEPFDVRIRNEIITKAVRVERGGAPAVLVQTMLNESVKDEKNLASSASNYMDASRLIKPANRKSPTRQTVPLPDVNGHHDDPTADHAFFSVFPQQEVEATKGLEPSGSWSAQDKAALDLVNDVMHHLHGTGDARPKFGSLEGEALISAKMDRAHARQKSWLISDDNDSKTTRLAHRQHWAVDYMSAGEMVKMGLVETYILQHFGRQARRIWKALDEKGKMEEKQIGKLVMLPAKDIREAVAALSKAGFIMQQEVPRTVDRNPSRAFFLWHVSRPHCYRLLLNHLYEALVNLYVRREHEREQHKALLRRSERSDVRENIQLLDSADRQELDVFEWRLESLGVAQERIDRDIFVLETMPAYTS